jgi:hypothetical protein
MFTDVVPNKGVFLKKNQTTIAPRDMSLSFFLTRVGLTRGANWGSLCQQNTNSGLWDRLLAHKFVFVSTEFVFSECTHYNYY